MIYDQIMAPVKQYTRSNNGMAGRSSGRRRAEAPVGMHGVSSDSHDADRSGAIEIHDNFCEREREREGERGRERGEKMVIHQNAVN